jgi:hypothetical protein
MLLARRYVNPIFDAQIGVLLVSPLVLGALAAFSCGDITLDKCKLPDGEIITSVSSSADP